MSSGHPFIIGSDVGGTNIRLGLFNPELGLREFRSLPTARIQDGTNTAARLVELISDYKRELETKYRIVAVSIGLPSVIDRERQNVVATTNIAGLENVPIVEMMASGVGLPTFLEKDTNLLLRHDMAENLALADGVTVGYYLGTGLGNAISINGNILVGRNGAAGELGHIPTRDVAGKCGCGNTSCIELVASGVNLQTLSNKLNNGQIETLFDEHANDPEIRSFLRDIAIPLATEINILDPDNVIIGGGVFQMSHFPRKQFEDNLRTLIRSPYPARNLRFSYATESQKNGVIGAGLHAVDQMKDVTF